jgi:hypothetical protein
MSNFTLVMQQAEVEATHVIEVQVLEPSSPPEILHLREFEVLKPNA